MERKTSSAKNTELERNSGSENVFYSEKEGERPNPLT